MADVAEYTKSVDIITEHVRAKLSRIITQLYTGPDGVIRLLVITSYSIHYTKLYDRRSTQQGCLRVSGHGGLHRDSERAGPHDRRQRIVPIVA